MLRQILLAGVALAILAVGTYWVLWRGKPEVGEGSKSPAEASKVQDGNTPVRIGAEARKNLRLSSKGIAATTYWRKIEIPGVITDRPGISDRGVVTPITGVVTKIHAFPGDAIAPDAPLFSLRLTSESLHASQLELFKSTKEIDIAKQQKQRLEGLAQSGGLAGSRLIEIDNQIQRMNVNVLAYRQDLLARGLLAEQIDAAAKGEFVREITVRAPRERLLQEGDKVARENVLQQPVIGFELQSLKVELGQQVDAGEVLCYLADHRSLLIEGRGFKKDMSLIQHAAKSQFPIDLSFELEESTDWPALPTKLPIHLVANTIDTQSRTFAFFLLLDNQSQTYVKDGQERILWRFRPGDRVRLSVAVEKLENVFVLPQASVVREGPEAFVFRQNGDLFDRLAVHVLYEDRTSIVVASDGSLRQGMFIAQNAAASINRVLKAQMASGIPANLHVHADGTVHAAH